MEEGLYTLYSYDKQLLALVNILLILKHLVFLHSEVFLDKSFQVVFGGHFSDPRLCKLITCFSFQQLQSRYKSFPSQKTLVICFPFIKLKLLFSSDQPGMLCSFKISTAWSCAWCLNPQADKTFSTGEFLYAFLQYAVGKKIMLTMATFIWPIIQ